MLFASFAGNDAWEIVAEERHKRRFWRFFGEQLNIFGQGDCCRCGVFALAGGVFSALLRSPGREAGNKDAGNAGNVRNVGNGAGEKSGIGFINFINSVSFIDSVSCVEQDGQDADYAEDVNDVVTECGDGEHGCNFSDSDFSESDIESVIARNSSAVYKLAMSRCGNRADADDIFQQVFLRYITRRPDFASAAHEKAWFLRVTVNCSKSFWSSAFRRNTQPMTEEMAAPQTEEHGLWAAVAAMPEKYRVLIHLFYYEGISTAEISQLLNRKESTVRMQLTRARRLLGERLKGEYDEIEF